MRTLSILSLFAIASATQAQVATPVLREGDPVPGIPGQTITALSNTAVTPLGLTGCSLNADDGTTTISHIWLGVGGVGSIVRSESTIGIYEQNSFESFFGVSNASAIAYSPELHQHDDRHNRPRRCVD